MSEEYLSCVEIEPPEGEARSAVVWLHGLGADGHDFEPIVPHLGHRPEHRVRFIFPHAPSRPVTINMGMIMPAWYDIRELSLKREVDEKGVLESAAQVVALIRRERERGIPGRRIVLAGFSQGGAIALHVGLRYPERLAGLIALSSYLVCDEKLEEERSGFARELPIFQAHGTADPMVPLIAGEAARDRLQALGHSIEWKSYPMGHEVCPQEITDIGAALNRFLDGAER